MTNPSTDSETAAEETANRSSASDAAAAFHDAKAEVAESFAKIGQRLGEIRAYAGYYAQTQMDAVKSKLIWLGIYAGLGIVAGVVAIASLATAGVLIVTGVAGGLGAAFGRRWLGDLVTGLGLVLLIGLGGVIAMKVLGGVFKKKLVAKYEEFHQDQRTRFGSDVVERSRDAQR